MNSIKVLGSSSKGNCYILEVEGECLLLECGVNWKDILKGLDFDITKVKGCLLSHHHKDHSRAAKEVMKNGITIYSNYETIIEHLPTGRKKVVKNNSSFEIGSFTVIPLEAHHNNSDGSDCMCTSYLIKHEKVGNIFFITDSFMTRYKFFKTKLDYILLEANYSVDMLGDSERADRLLRSHMSIDIAEKFMDNVIQDNLKEVMLIHLSSDNSDEEEFKSRIEKKAKCKVSIAKKDYEMRFV